jgi:hypothetical protein
MLQRFTLRRTVSDLHALYQAVTPSEQTGRKYYRRAVSIVRLLAGIPLFAFIGVRLFLADGYLWFTLRNQFRR